jgi:archaellum component FlaC
VEDEYLSLEEQLDITFEVVSQLDEAEVFRSLSPEELSLRVFLIEQIRSLQLIVEMQDDAPSLSQEPP